MPSLPLNEVNMGKKMKLTKEMDGRKKERKRPKSHPKLRLRHSPCLRDHLIPHYQLLTLCLHLSILLDLNARNSVSLFKVAHLGHRSASLQPSDSPLLPSFLPFPQANTLGPVSIPDALTTPGASNEQGLPIMNDGSVQFHSPSSHVPASSSSLSSSNASVRPFQLLQPLQPLQSITASSDRGAGPSTEHEQTILSLSSQSAHVPSIRPDAHTRIPSPLFLRMPPISSLSMSSCNPSSSFTDPGPTLASSSTTADQLSVPTREKEKDQIEVDRNDTQTGKIESIDKGKGKERLGETQDAGLFTVAGAVPLSFWVYGGPRARTLEIVIIVSPFPSLISLSIHVFLFPVSFLFYP